MKTLKKIFNLFVTYFLRGIIVVVPLVAVVLTGAYIWSLVRDYELFGSVWITIGMVIAGLLIVGFTTKFLIFRPLFNAFENVITRTPLVKFVYTSIKDLIKAFVGDQRRFSQPVLVNLIEETRLERFGFLTTQDLARMGEGLKGKVTVYIPMSYSFSGNLYVVPAELVTPLPDVDPAELMKFILAGGVTDLDELMKDDSPSKENNSEIQVIPTGEASSPKDDLHSSGKESNS